MKISVKHAIPLINIIGNPEFQSVVTDGAPRQKSGVRVFADETAGTGDVMIGELLDEAEKKGLKIGSVRLFVREDDKNRFNLAILLTSKHKRLSREVVAFVRDYLGAFAWGSCHVWRNPPVSDLRTDSIHLASRRTNCVDKTLQLSYELA